MLVALSASLLIFIYALVKVEYAVNFINEILEKMPIPKKYFYQLLKMLGITYAADFSSNICKDAGYQTIAGQIEIFGKLSVFVLSMPVSGIVKKRGILKYSVAACLILVCIMNLATSSYNPFIYFRF